MWIFTRFMVLFYTNLFLIYLIVSLTMGLHSLNAIFSSDHSCSIFVLMSVLCYHFLNTLQFENELKKVGTFVKLTFLYWLVSCLTFYVSFFFCFTILCFWLARILSISTSVAMVYVLKKRRVFANKVKVVYSKSNIM